jgi:hypothetical protein
MAIQCYSQLPLHARYELWLLDNEAQPLALHQEEREMSPSLPSWLLLQQL